MKSPTRSQLDYQNVKLISCPSCGVEIADDVLEEHTKSVPCAAKAEARKAEAMGLTRCEDAILEQLSEIGVPIAKFKTRVRTHDGFSRKTIAFYSIEEQWADRVAVELMRQPGFTMDERIAAVEKYLKWRERYPNAKVRVSKEQRTDLWRKNNETRVSFRRGVACYDGVRRYGIFNDG